MGSCAAISLSLFAVRYSIHSHRNSSSSLIRCLSELIIYFPCIYYDSCIIYYACADCLFVCLFCFVLFFSCPCFFFPSFFILLTSFLCCVGVYPLSPAAGPNAAFFTMTMQVLWTNVLILVFLLFSFLLPSPLPFMTGCVGL